MPVKNEASKLRAIAEGVVEIDLGSEQSKQAAQLEITQILDRLVLQARKVEGKVN
jgi:hypothetical protein